MSNQINMDKREFIKLLNEYFLGLIHYQYSINNGEKNAVKEYKIQDKYLQYKLWKKIQELIHSERLKWNKEMREKIEQEIEYSKSHHEVVLENWEEDKSDVFKSKSEVRGFLIALDAFKELLEQLEEKK